MGRREQVENKHSVLLVCCLFLFLLLFSIIPLPTATAKSIYPKVELMLVTPEVTVDVSHGQEGIVEFQGMVYIECAFNMSGIIKLSAKDTWASATVIPSALSFSEDNQGYRSFKVKVKAPLYTSSDFTGKFRVTGSCYIYSPTGMYCNCEPREGVEGRINVAQFRKFQLSSPNKYTAVDPGQTTNFRIFVVNQGNGNETFYVNIANKENLKKNGLKVSISPTTFELGEHEEQTVRLIVTTPEGYPIHEIYNIRVEVSNNKTFTEGGGIIVETYQIRNGASYYYQFQVFCISLITILAVLFVITVFYARRKQKKKKYVKKW
jgi:hypothetical protein